MAADEQDKQALIRRNVYLHIRGLRGSYEPPISRFMPTTRLVCPSTAELGCQALGLRSAASVSGKSMRIGGRSHGEHSGPMASQGPDHRPPGAHGAGRQGAAL